MKKLFSAATIGLACLTLAGCVSEGPGYGYYEQSYVVYDRPGYVYRDHYRDHYHRRDWDRDRGRHDRSSWRDNERPGRDRWQRERAARSERNPNSAYRRDGRVWVPND